VGFATALGGQQSGKPPRKQASKASVVTDEGDGEKLFNAHCNRCHTAPQELSPRVARTVLQHMRERAMLSKKDEQAILNYLAPQ
jgi:cytochrome c5